MRLSLMALGLSCSLGAYSQTTNMYTTATTWTVPSRVYGITVTVYGGAGGTGGQDCGAGCTNAAAGNAGFVVAKFGVVPGNVVGIYPGGAGANGTSAATASGGGNGGVSTYTANYNGGKGGNAGPTGSSGAGGGGGAATVLTISSTIKIVAAGAGGGGGMANQVASGQAGSNTYTANGSLNTGGAGTAPAGDGGGGGGGGGGNFGGTGGGTHAAGAEQAGNGGNIGGNLISGAVTTTSNTNIIWTSGGRIDITYTLVALPVTWLSFTATPQINGSVLLNWSTAEEVNSRSYTIQRSNDAVSWTAIGDVAAAGTTSATSTYTFTDVSAAAGRWYYRLAQTDLDGKINYSKTLTCTTAGGNTFRVFPNPVDNGVTTVSLSAASELILYNANGQTLLHKQLPAGDSRLVLSSYRPGVYFLQAGGHKISLVIK